MVDPALITDIARDLAKGVLELLDEVPPEWDGGSLGYLVGGVRHDATELLAALEDKA
jgi:hypothetical protein